MIVRVSRLLKELNIGLNTLEGILKALGVKELDLSPNMKISDDISTLVKLLCSNDIEFLKLVEIVAGIDGFEDQCDSIPTLKIDGSTFLRGGSYGTLASQPLIFSDKPNFWIDELVLFSPEKEVNDIDLGSFEESDGLPLYSVLIGINGVGKSSLMKEIVDFFIDLHTCASDAKSKLSSSFKIRLKGIRYHIDGMECEVIRLHKNYIAKINGCICDLKELRLPSIVACHFGAFDKFPTQKVYGSAQTKYDVPFYKYMGAHVNGSMISSSAIAFRLFFALNEQMNDRQRQNICSILDFIGYDHRITLSYSLVLKSKKDTAPRDIISQRVEKAREYNKLDKQEKNKEIAKLYTFYKNKISSGYNRFEYNIDFDKNIILKETLDELQYIYKLKQCNLVNSVNVIFYKQGYNNTSEEMSSGEFAILSTVLSISAAADSPHTLVLLDEPELSLHPNWQMTLIDNLDRALANQVCHLLISTHSHMLVSDLPMKRSSVIQVEKDEKSNLNSTRIHGSTYGWSAEEILLKVFKTATDRNRYFGELIGQLLERMGNNTISPKEVEKELRELQKISMHLSDIDPMKTILNTIVETYK